jgi:segregation and condensation protein A
LYKIQLSNFEGPFDLLLYFIKRDELNIYDIPISKVTKEFLNYVHLMQTLDLDLAGEFIVMSSTLMHIKSQMLLPREEDEDGNLVEDPRTELVQKLLEYKQIKEKVDDLNQAEKHTRYMFYRNNFPSENKEGLDSQESEEINLFHIINAFQNILKRRGYENIKHNVTLYSYTIAEQRDFILKELNINAKLSFSKLIKNANKLKIVVTFLALLDLIKTGNIQILQNGNYQDINITKVRIKN